MSDKITHECGIAMVRLLKPLSYYQEKYGTPLWGFTKLFLLMEKQHNRGQDGAGVACVKSDIAPGEPYMFRDRCVKTNPLDKIFKTLLGQYNEKVATGEIHPEFAETVKKHFDFGGELLMGHLRYGTSGGYNISSCHPYFRRSPWPTRNLALCGNFNMTNTEELNRSLIAMGQHPIFATDTQAMLEKIGFFLDEEHEELFRKLRGEGLTPEATSQRISDELDLARVITRASQKWDGGYTLCGLIGNGDAFVARDPSGIRPCWYFQNDEVIAFASERAPLMTVFDLTLDQPKEVNPGHVVVLKRNGHVSSSPFTAPLPRTSCSFERIYFSRGNDIEIYQERKLLGGRLADQVLKAVGYDWENTVFSFVPNTAEVAYYGLMHALREKRRDEVKKAVLAASAAGELTDALLDDLILRNWPRGEKVVSKDIKIRTFIGQEGMRNQLASHVYDITYGSIKPGDHLVCVDDSIVRGTTLRRSILRILSRLNPKKIVIVSTAPQIRFPDCYGIDMSELGKFVAFEATVTLLKERGQSHLLQEVYELCREAVAKGECVNHVRKIYEPFTPEEISAKITELVRPKNIEWQGEFEIIYQTIENLHAAVPNHTGDWYFTGKYPTPGGFRVVNQAYLNYFEKGEGRSY
ncbi:MAG: amidophosphoribosyltransferase [Opitutus sp.]|nr:amidophosphoribosyltransferase [Opitutus sp.]MCS6246922.1 amidophosphoribosyltransferase [Opitutus sp.]MCS6273143.1 amidophosphoribosyltransferase [Opitutus sp.]MCS6279048.1 amidophosphoribosyltransferase [Opitutus sp.]MCS6298617.1 amidophosphoribosyltransferase [Opitutus sp.]